jgi:hypothetical protein
MVTFLEYMKFWGSHGTEGISVDLLGSGVM